jgi:oligopeptide/dipeptide ABC transporter ATP-binding protein
MSAPASTSLPALSVEGLHVHFALDRTILQAVRGVTFSVDAGETVAVVGESGSGKTVTALAVMGLIERPGVISDGDIHLAGRPLVGLREAEYRQVRGRDLAMVFQDPMTALNPVQRVGRQVEEAIAVHRRARSRRVMRAQVLELLERVGLVPAAKLARAYPHELSGGMRQRVMLAMALANHPRVLIADEPTTALDVTTQAQILELLAEMQREMGLALVLVTHDLGIVAGMADRIVVMYAGRVIEEGSVDRVFTRSGHPYTRGLLASVPRFEQGRERESLAAIPGTPPDPGRIPPGCAFHPRCPIAEERCHDIVPELRALGEGHRAACHFADEVSAGARPV